MNRREFLQRTFYSSLIYGASALPRLISPVNAAFQPLQNSVLVNLMLEGGPDFRHLIVPEYDSNTNSFGNHYWKHRWRAHGIANNTSAWQARWNNDYYPITIDAPGTPNDGIVFGIWREAGWLIRMYEQGNVALVCNALVGDNRAHDHSTVQLNQGNVLSGVNDLERSGWGGRLARVAGGNALALTNTPSPFCFGPQGVSPTFDPNQVNNQDLISVQNSRTIGLYDFDLSENQTYNTNYKLARSLKSYYVALHQEQIGQAYEKFMDHESKVREFGELMGQRLDFDEPLLIRALYSDTDYSGAAHSINNDPNNGEARRVLRNSQFGQQIRNLYDVMASNDILSLRVASLDYGGWDSHADQRQNENATDLNDPDLDRGIENGFKDIFGGPNVSVDNNALHGGFSALWENLNQVDKDEMVITVAGEFGRQIRDNGDNGTDHGIGNIMMMIGEGVNGGVYGEIFPQAEIQKYDDTSLNTPDIDGLTEIDQLFAPVCDWVTGNGAGNVVFPRLTLSAGDENYPSLESSVSFSALFSA